MNAIARMIRGAAALLAFSAALAHAGGPLGVCNGQPLKYAGAGAVTLHYDRGGLGSRSNGEANALVNNALALWNNVATSSMTLTRGADLPVDVTVANYTAYLSNGGDGLNPVIYDTDGSIVDDYFGTGARNSILGFAGSGGLGAPTCRYTHGQAVINGAIGVSSNTLTVVLAHEIGHLIGLDHTQLDATQGLTGANYPLMYPIAYRSVVSLHSDDTAAVSALYPDSSFGSVYGQLSGEFRNGGTPLHGANLWAREVNTNALYSIVSDYLMQNTGFFRLSLPAGTYILAAEAIDREFTEGSGVGPYSDDLSDSSFQHPFYSGSTPMAPVTLGNGSPIRIAITAGCAANAAFNLNGTGTITGNCVAEPASMTSPANASVLAGASQLFQWTSATGATLYRVLVGSSAGASDIGSFPASGTTGTSTTIAGLPTDGRTLHVRLVSVIGGVSYTRDYTYTAATAVASSTAPSTEFNADRRSDLLWRNSSTGQVYWMLMNGLTVGGGHLAYTEPNTAWKIVGDADFTGDGLTDLLWRNEVTGHVYVMPSNFPAAGAVVAIEPDPAWKIVHTPDLDGDGKADILWWNSSSGQAYAMLLNGSAITAYGVVHTEPNTAWKIVAVGDFAGSGKRNQLVWRNGATGQVYLMTVTVSGGAFTQTGAVIYQEANTAWKILAAADFNGDGKSDLLWRNDMTGQIYAMLMNGTAIASQGMVYQETNLAWKVVAQGDYNGDGKADLLWRNETTGHVYMMLMNGLAIAAQAMVLQEPNTAWKLLGPWEYGRLAQ